jgi:16S rRNA processing protein RimM
VSAPADARLILMGRIGAAHGVKGEVRIASFAADPLALGRYGPLATSRPGLFLTVTAARPAGNVIVARLAGIEDRNAAEALAGVELFVDRDSLPAPDDDDFYIADLIGLEARLTDGTVIGAVAAVPNHGAGDIIEVRDSRSGQTFLFAFTRQVVPELHVAEGYLVIDPPIEAEPGEEEPD